MYEIRRYFDVNIQGTAILLEVLGSDKGRTVKSIVVASSRAVYGEGSYQCHQHGLVFPDPRTADRMVSGDFDLYCPQCGVAVTMAPTDETAPFRPLSMYGLTKQVQEQAVLMFARTKGLNAFALRYQNVYGPGQSLKNPYTGILAVFTNLARQGYPIEVYEDGNESRDFVYIDDISSATSLAIAYKGNYIGALNVGTGNAITVRSVAEEINGFFGRRSEVRITGAFRVGDIRHNQASTKKMESLLHFTPMFSFREGVRGFLTWAETQPEENPSAYRKSTEELDKHGLLGTRR